MGLTYVETTVRPSGKRGRGRKVRLLIDSGAIYSVLPQADWRALHLGAERELEFVLADGTSVKRGVSECSFEIEGRRATSPVVLGVLGAVTLETLGMMLDPLQRKLLPMRMVLARLRPTRRTPPDRAGSEVITTCWQKALSLSFAASAASRTSGCTRIRTPKSPRFLQAREHRRALRVVDTGGCRHRSRAAVELPECRSKAAAGAGAARLDPARHVPQRVALLREHLFEHLKKALAERDLSGAVR
jgi:predicted aspartyl protease